MILHLMNKPKGQEETRSYSQAWNRYDGIEITTEVEKNGYPISWDTF